MGSGGSRVLSSVKGLGDLPIINFRTLFVLKKIVSLFGDWFFPKILSPWWCHKTVIDDSQRKNVSEDFFRVIYIDRMLYYWIILVICVIAVVGNLLVIRSVFIRNYKYLQKTCMISLALSDLLTVVMFAMNYLDLLATPLITWTLGEFLCWYIPVGQVLGNLASSLALLVIALDRYHNVIYALSKKWDPSWWKCLLGAAVLWGLCIGVSYPMSTFYFHIPLRIPSGDVYMCSGTSTTRSEISFYYISANILFFLPLITMFFWFYYKIAILIWKHRKPVSSKTNTTIEESENSSYTKATSEQAPTPRLKSAIKKKNMQVERKIRTFKIVIVLILAFIGLRMPYWLFWLYKLLVRAAGQNIWRFTFIFTALNLLNCALNPFLYTYLNQTIYVSRKLNEFICKTCCCCFSNAEFEDYEKGTPIAEEVMGYNNKGATVEQPRAGKIPPVYPYDKFPQVPYFPKYTSVNRF